MGVDNIGERNYTREANLTTSNLRKRESEGFGLAIQRGNLVLD